MSTQKAKFELFARLAALGFSYDESAELRRIEMTLSRWGERECGDGSDWAIERDDVTGKPFNAYHGAGKPRRYPIADRETGALKRARQIVAARNLRQLLPNGDGKELIAYHQGDCRGCSLYLVRRSDIPESGSIDSFYTRGWAVCA
jgi:hypothetical protein